jgi:hypothetical protein
VKDYKIGLCVFLFLATVISLLPPFEFGNEKLKTLQERNANYRISEKLPVKKYDFIFSGIKRNIILDYHTFQKKFYNQDSFNHYKNLWKESEFNFINSDNDTFFTIHRTIFKKAIPKKNEFKYKTKIWEPEKERKIMRAWHPEDEDPINSSSHYNTLLDNDYDAINFNEVKNEYSKSPDDWDFKRIIKIDSVKKFNVYNIIYPKYYLLNREILFGELMVEYFLAFILSIAVQLIVNLKRKPIG